MGFEGLTGQDEIKRVLTDYSAGKGGLSLLFAGSSGMGKHLFAKEAAKSFLCSFKGENGACGKCPSCRYVDAGTHPDLIWAEPTESRKNIRVSDLRVILSDADVKPQISMRKVIIINADKTDNTCQNLMLKSLEEPSDFITYILLCSDLSKILPTILSRVITLSFKEYSNEQMKQILIGKGGADLPEDRLEFLSSFSSNIPGRAIALMSDTDFMEQREHIFDLVINMPNMSYTDLLYDEYGYFESNKDRMDELLLLLIWTLGDIASAIASPSPSNLKNSDKRQQIMKFVSDNNAVTLINISNAQSAVLKFIDASKVNVVFELSCCNMLLHIYKELKQ